jgi:hypothetical protein
MNQEKFKKISHKLSYFHFIIKEINLKILFGL